MNKKFGRLNDGLLELAPTCGKIDNIMYLSFTEEQYREMKYKEIIDVEPPMKDGFEIKFSGYSQDDDSITLNYEYVEIPKTPIVLSKIKVKIALIKLGLWDKFVEWMENTMIPITDEASISCMDAWDSALVFDSSDEMFAPYLEQAKELFSELIDENTLNELIKSCEAQ